MKIYIKIDKKSWICWGIAVLYFWNLIENNVYNGLSLKFTNYFPSSLSTFFMVVVLATFIILKGDHNVRAYIFLTFILLSIGISCFNNSAREYLEAMYFGVSQIKKYIFIPFSFLCIKEPKNFLDRLYPLCILAGGVHIYTYISNGYLNAWNQVDYMGFGMEMLVPISIILLYAFNNKSIIAIIFSCIYGLYTMTVAHRGVILVIFALLVVYSYLYTSATTKLRISIVLLIGGSILYLNYEKILSLFIRVLNQYNIESRTLQLILQGTVENASGRSEIWRVCLESIKNNFWIGTGIGSDRALLNRWVGNFYSHNFALELWIAFGGILGSFLIGLIIWMGWHSVQMKLSQGWRNLFLPFYIVSIVTLLTSNSIFVFQPMWISIVIFCMLRKKEKLEKNAGN